MSEIEAERWQRLALIRGELERCRRCLDFWEAAPKLNRDEILLSLQVIERSIAKEKDEAVFHEFRLFVLNRIKTFRETVLALGNGQESARRFGELYGGYRMAHRLERMRRRGYEQEDDGGLARLRVPPTIPSVRKPKRKTWLEGDEP